MKFYIYSIYLLLSVFSFGQAQHDTLKNWRFKPEKFYQEYGRQDFPATVPGVIHLDLMNAGLAPDFYAGDQEHSSIAQWIELENWIYSTEFDWDKSTAAKHTSLVFEGLDTYANVYLNDSLILRADNMFRRWEIPVDQILLNGKNRLLIKFESSINHHRRTLETAPYKLPSGNETGTMQVSAYTRKAACHFGWDWGPRFVTCGIWRPCYLKSWSGLTMDHFFAQTLSLDKNEALMRFEFELESDTGYAEACQVQFLNKFFTIKLNKGKNKISLEFVLEDAQIWYPNGHGDHPIYTEDLSILNPRDKLIFSESVRFSVRTVELVREQDSIGTSFYFLVNEKPVFMKGANYIPQDIFLPRVTEEKTESLLQLAQACNMNMLRVWGGGIYESDLFYEQCDERGIMIWQDFMFANSMYPDDPVFKDNIAAEIRDNVQRLRNHPCIALWCGNNEIDVAWHNWGWQQQYGYTASDSEAIWKNYQAIFHELIPETLKELDPTTSYIPSSPESNWGKAENFNHGAMHYWGVWHGQEPLSNFKTHIGRFMVEYGFQSYPHLDPFMHSTTSDFLPIDSATLRNRQKSYVGDTLIEAEISKLFGNDLDFNDWIWASQYVQSEALKTAIIAHRMSAPHCMGTLFWQFNDCWFGPSWSVLDYYQREKLAFQTVQKYYAPVIVVLEENQHGLELLAHADIHFSGILEFSLLLEDGTPAFIQEIPLHLDALETKNVRTFQEKKLFKGISKSKVQWSLRVLSKTSEEVFYDSGVFRKLRLDEIY